MTENDIFLSKLNDKITLLAEQVNLSTKNLKNIACFDPQLFNYQGPLLQGYLPYLLEIKSNYEKLVALVNKIPQTPNIIAITYLSEIIVNQLTALQRELATNSLRKADKTIYHSETLHEKHAKNLGYLNRLESMKYALQNSSLNQIEKSKQLTILDERLARCRDTLLNLEQKIEMQ